MHFNLYCAKIIHRKFCKILLSLPEVRGLDSRKQNDHLEIIIYKLFSIRYKVTIQCERETPHCVRAPQVNSFTVEVQCIPRF